MKASFVFKISLVLNLALILTFFWMKHHESGQEAQSLPLPPSSSSNFSHLFHWSQLESSDYPTYIFNLRTIGCPEQTVREIIAADVDDLFAPRRAPLLAKLGGANVEFMERSQAESLLNNLRQEEASTIRGLFGIPNPTDPDGSPGVRVAVSSPTLRTPRAMVEDTNVVVPLVFQSIDINAMNVTEDELQTIDQVRQSFLTALGTNQDLRSPAYLRTWQVAQKQADNLLGALLGRQAVMKLETGLVNQDGMSASEASRN